MTSPDTFRKVDDIFSTWEVNDHLGGTSYHKIQMSNKKEGIHVQGWISYWKHHTGLEVPRYCPGNKVDVDKSTKGQTKAHRLENVVGAHVRIKDPDGNVRFAVVPACKKCNNVANEVRPSCYNLLHPPPSSDPILPVESPRLAV
jgi:hypothetical protein